MTNDVILSKLCQVILYVSMSKVYWFKLFPAFKMKKVLVKLLTEAIGDIFHCYLP